MRSTNRMDRRGISNVVATIILIAVAIALAVAVAVWVFGLAGGAAKTATLQIQAVSLNNTATLSSSKPAYLSLLVSNPSGTAVGINGFTLGGLTCTFSPPISVPAGAQGEFLVIALTGSSGYFTGVSISNSYIGGTPLSSSLTATCSGNQTAAVGAQYSGTIVTTSGQQYPFTVTATS
ncbi:archaellin/type IV pilin N-terminal domain-containing protein [Vulcanisaeta sp. EB80]|uniref:archaellin/type IV pilin N-terminal domain-containing protein n=1 Tax=Vulcanisaeta sp. EB80 TaxID=1650660 RepID=UPI001EE3D996|nr:archaellin/type IV pilin N-terminal domain-containing protein [Vulcanisaeta sp. EB80]